MLRQWLEACRASEKQAQSEVAQARDTARAALQSRSRLAARLVDAADRSGSHPCEMQEIAHEPQVLKWARREDEDSAWYHRSGP
jgi:hypothetical protein